MKTDGAPITYYNCAYGDLIRKHGGDPTPPVKEIVAAVEKLKAGRALDIGCGIGRNCLFMARRGFSVKAVDSSEVAISHIRAVAKKEDLPIQAINANILATPLECEFNLINASYVLDEFDKLNAYWLVRRMQESTVPGGLNCIVVCGEGTKRVQRFKFRNHFFTEEELISLYEAAGWKIISRTTLRQNLHGQLIPVIRLILEI